jgi:DNA end-binding protein Ku
MTEAPARIPERQPEPEPEPVRLPAPAARAAKSGKVMPIARAVPHPEPEPEPEFEPSPREISRSEIVKGYEFAKDRYVTLTKEELAAITPQTAREMQILEFVQLAEIDPIYYETSYYVSPDRGGERAYALLFEALRQSGFVAIAQVAMHNREHVVVLRPCRTGIALHTMFYETEIRREDEYRTDTGNVSQKEMELALLLIRNLAASFEPAKYRDTYREKLDELIQRKIAGEETIEPPAPAAPPVVNILEALQKSLAATSRKPPVSEETAPRSSHRPRTGGKRT